jgi:NAD-dependent deacetylase
MTKESPGYQQIAAWLAGSEGHIIAFTGAGISTESGIPDFRSPGGVWAKNQPVLYHDFLHSAASRHEYWRQKCEAHTDMATAKPNIGHRTLADWEQTGLLKGVITQNIDGMHQLAGSRRVLELHGTARQVACLDCDLRLDTDPLVEEFRRTDCVPPCPECGGRLKHATISFGQSLLEDIINEAAILSETAGVYLAIGSSLVVHPAAGLPELAKRAGARLILINRDPTPLDSLADVVIREPIGQALESINRCLSADGP